MVQQPTENRPPEHAADPRVDRALAELTELLRRGRRMRVELAARLDGSQLTDSQLLALWFCGQWAADAPEAGVPQHELAEAIALSPAQTSHLLEQLRAHGWLSSYRPPRDRRRQLWRLTPDGERQLHGALSRLEEWAAAWMEPPPATPAAPSLRVFVGEDEDHPLDAASNSEPGDAPC